MYRIFSLFSMYFIIASLCVSTTRVTVCICRTVLKGYLLYLLICHLLRVF